MAAASSQMSLAFHPSSSHLHSPCKRNCFRGVTLKPAGSSSCRKLHSFHLSVHSMATEPEPKLDQENDTHAIVSNIKYHSKYTSFSPLKFELKEAYIATAESVRDSLIQRWNETYEYFSKSNPKQIYYLSMEFLQGRALLNALGNLGMTDPYSQALLHLGHTLENIAEQEPDAALGNGGLGRLASCFLDSLATLNYPAWGYGLRYKYGLFQQRIAKEGQEEVPEKWLELGNPWEIPRRNISFPIKFFGEVVEDSSGQKQWVGGEEIKAVAYDIPIPGYRTNNTLNLRLWSTEAPTESFDLRAFNDGHHDSAAKSLTDAAKICYVLYPGDETIEGKLLRLKQQYTLCSASLQDIIARFKERSVGNIVWTEFPNKVAIQMNDTHPTLCVPELMHILIDIEGLSWEEAWNITQSTVAYTNHTVLPEALEKWPLEILQRLLPRHMQIIKLIDEEFINSLISTKISSEKEDLKKKIEGMRILENVDLPESIKPFFVVQPVAKNDSKLKGKKSTAPGEAVDIDEAIENNTEEANAQEEIFDNDPNKVEQSEAVDPDEDILTDTQKVNDGANEVKLERDIIKGPALVRMANLCVVSAHAVNGVAAIHTEIVKNEVFNDFYQIWPQKFQNKTNGVTPRRWIRFCNPELSNVITKWLGSDDWVLKTERLKELRKHVDNKELQKDWKQAKKANKLKLVSYIKEKTGYIISADSLFDIQVKRIHEYKRQLLNILGIIYRYRKMKSLSSKERKEKYVPRVCFFGGKAFATYVQAKRIVKLITDVGSTINNDPDIGDLLKVVFVPDYNVSVAEVLIPASDLSQHISTAGMEASGTSNMKFAMNGCVLIGTLDGANVEIRDEVGHENFFLFGAYAHEIAGLRKERAEGKFKPDPRFKEATDFIESKAFGSYDFTHLLGSLEGKEGYGRGDYFLVGKDFPSYIECQDLVDEAYRDEERWTKMSIMNAVGSSFFSSDRTIHEYAGDIWRLETSIVPGSDAGR